MTPSANVLDGVPGIAINSAAPPSIVTFTPPFLPPDTQRDVALELPGWLCLFDLDFI